MAFCYSTLNWLKHFFLQSNYNNGAEQGRNDAELRQKLKYLHSHWLPNISTFHREARNLI